MKTKFKKNGRRLLAAILCLVMAVMALPMSAFAWTSEEGVSCTSSFGDYYVGSDGGYYRSKSSYSFIVYDSDGNTSVRTISAGNAKRKYLMTDSSGTHQVYCVESGIDFNTGNSYVSKNGKNSSYFRKLPTEAQFGVMMALMYGWHEGKSSPVAGTNTDDYAFATQTIIWEYQQQLRTSPSDLHSANGIDADTYRSSLKGRPAEKCYDWILSQMASHYTIPSFAARNQSKADTYTLKYNPDKQDYSLTLTDTNNTLANLSLSASGIKVSRSGNQYTFTSDKMITSPITVSAQKAVNLDCDEMLIWGCVGKQTMVSGASDPVYFYFKLDTETYGTGFIKKTSEDGVVSGIKFNISGNGVNQTVVTKAGGTVDISLMPGVYTVTEQPIDRYEPQNVQRITIVSGHTSTVTFSNTLKRGSLEIIKSSEDNLVEGVKFYLYGTSLSGLPVDEYAVTDANGVARFENVLISGTTPYTVEEIDTAVRYVVPASQTAPIEWEKVTSRSFTNILKKFNVTVTKSDAETGTAQGDASLAGAVYGIYKGEELIDTYTTDKNGQFTTKYYVCGNDWTVREISPSEGYLLDRTIHRVGAEPELYTVEFNSTANDVTEQVIKGNIAIIKHTDNGETQIETPETGATFEVFRKAAGSFDAAKETERDILTCDENGFAQTKDMPYGIYTVRQTSGWEGRELMKPFDVFISKDGQTYRYLINNANFESYIKVVKKDAETGNTIPYAGAGFQIYDPNGNLVTMTFTYPEVTTIDTFYTTADGELITPQTLEYGKGYSLVEVQAPYGYVLNSEPVYFDVMQENSEIDSGITVIEVVRSNVAQKGTITVSKSGEVFSSVNEAGGLYQPVYAVRGLKDAVYEITAAEDIYTLDGTLRASKGEVVDTVSTGADGTAVSKELYLGKYEVKEITAPFGMILNEETHAVELVYAGQNVAVTETAASFYNERQRVEIDLTFEFESDCFRMGDRYGRVIFLREYAAYIKDSMVAELCELNRNMMLSVDIIPVPTDEAVREVENRLLGVETNITNWQRKQNQNNNFSAVIPYDLEQQRKESKEFLDDLTTRDQRMMFAVLTMVHTADTKEQLDNDTEALLTTARKHLCQFAVLKYQQMDGLNTALPFGVRKIDALRTLTTESLAVFIPFRVQEIYHENGVYYGQNVISKNMIIANRRQLLNGNSFILGVSGAGKSFTAKEEMTNIILTDPNADIIIIDPEREYSPLVKAMQGEVIHIAATSENHINAMDMNSDYGDGANPVILKSEFILSLCEQLIGGTNLGAKQKSIIDRCTASVYRYYQQGNYMGTPPTLQDFREELLKQNEPEAQEIALAIELFTDGSLNTFAKHTNVDTHSRLICYDILDLGKQLQPIGMLVVLDSILNRITQNRAKGRNTFIFIDEIYLLFQHEYSANFLFTLWKRVRKYGAYCTGITQNVDDLLQSHTARTMLANSEFIIMLNQASTDRLELAKLLNISDLQMSYITNVGAGQGLLKVGSSLVPFVNKFPRNTELYKLMTTKFGEV